MPQRARDEFVAWAVRMEAYGIDHSDLYGPFDDPERVRAEEESRRSRHALR